MDAMHHRYADILDRIPEAPTWFDEYAVPRFVPFAPDRLADIYATEAALVEIACAGCERPFLVAFSVGRMEMILRKGVSLEQRVRDKTLHYGDPPNIDCCPSGPTMNSDPVRVVEFWSREKFDWRRRPELEVSLNGDGAADGA